MAVTLSDEKILDSWGVVMEGGAGKDGGLLQNICSLLKYGDLPGVSWQQIETQTSMLKGLFGKKRSYLMITNESVKDYRMYLGARDYGKHLDISWFLTVVSDSSRVCFQACWRRATIRHCH